MTPGKTKRWLARITVLLASTVVAALLGTLILEGALRIMGFEYQLFPERIEFGYPDPELFDSLYVADPDLFWVRTDYQERLAQSRDIDVVFIGDSCTEFGRYDVLLTELAKERTGRTFSFLNAGFGGWTSYQGRRQLERDIVPLKPRVATIYFGWNDHWIGFGIEDQMIGEINDSIVYTLRNWRVVQLGVGLYIASKNSGASLKRVSPPDFERNLREMVRLARSNGITPVLITPPTSHEKGREPAHLANRWLPDIEEMVPLHQEYVAIVRNVAAEEDVILCDLAMSFEKIPQERKIREYFKMDGIHFEPPGDRVAAEFIYTTFEEHGLWDMVLGDDPNPRQFPGRTFPGEINPPPKVAGDPSLPLLAEIENVTRDPDGMFRIEGWVLSPDPVDYVVVWLGDRNMGIAIFPVQSPDVAEQHPRYNDPFARFIYIRKGIDDVLKTTREGRLEFWSVDKKLGESEFVLEE